MTAVVRSDGVALHAPGRQPPRRAQAVGLSGCLVSSRVCQLNLRGLVPTWGIAPAAAAAASMQPGEIWPGHSLLAGD